MTARAPEPTSFFPFEFGDFRAIIVGRRYERVFPVPVGEMAARSRFYVDKDRGPPISVRQHTSKRMGIAYDWMLVGLEYPYFSRFEAT